MQCLSLEYTSHLFLSKRKTRLRDQDNTWTEFKCSTMLRMHTGVKVMTFDLLWSSLRPDTGCESEPCFILDPGADSFLFCHEREHGPVLSPEAGGQSVTRSRPRRTCEARVSCCLVWPCTCEGLFRAGNKKIIQTYNICITQYITVQADVNRASIEKCHVYLFWR